MKILESLWDIFVLKREEASYPISQEKLGGCFAQTNPVSFLLSLSVFVCLVSLRTLAFQHVGAQRLTGGRSGRRFAPPSGVLARMFAQAAKLLKIDIMKLTISKITRLMSREYG